jgi:hypothetical protein
MKSITLNLVVLMCLAHAITSAQNLVPNSDFELGTPYCGIMMGAAAFNSSIDGWYSPTTAECDIYYTEGIESDCYNLQPENDYPGPIGIKGSELPHSGNTFIGIRTYSIAETQQREYIQAELTAPTLPGTDYIISCWVSAGDSLESFSNNLGFLLSTDAISSSSNLVLELSPTSNSAEIISNTDGWVLYSDTVNLTEAFQYITVGNFFDDDATSLSTNPAANTQPGNYGAYYFIDDLTLEQVPVSVSEKFSASSFSMSPNPSKALVTIAGMAHPFSITISNQMGQAVMEKECMPGTVQLDVAHLPSGIYLVHVIAGGQLQMQRLIKE